MCENHLTENAAKRRRNPAKLDPTHTGSLRRGFVAQMRRRFGTLQKEVIAKVDTEDCFGLKNEDRHIIFNAGEFGFPTDAEKLEAFMKWFKQQVDSGILGVSGGVDPDKPWTGVYVDSAYKRGVVQAYTRLHRQPLAAQQPFYEATKAQFLRDSFATPEAISKIKMLSTRSYELLKGISVDMGAKLNMKLAEGLSAGRHPYVIAREIAKGIEGISIRRAETLARTEIIHAHAEGMLDSFEALGVDEVGIEAEWQTAGDGRVCPLCSDLSGEIFTVAAARGMLPRHPNCRCAWMPYVKSIAKYYSKRERTPTGFQRVGNSTIVPYEVWITNLCNGIEVIYTTAS